jgi:hypothetical protein
MVEVILVNLLEEEQGHPLLNLLKVLLVEQLIKVVAVVQQTLEQLVQAALVW